VSGRELEDVGGFRMHAMLQVHTAYIQRQEELATHDFFCVDYMFNKKKSVN